MDKKTDNPHTSHTSSSNSNQPSLSPSTILLRIKSSSSPTDSDITIPTDPKSTVSSLKESIQSALGRSTRGRYIRLIHSGRLLAPDSAPLTNFKLKDGSVVHAVVAAAGVRGGQQAVLAGSRGSGAGAGAGSGGSGGNRYRRRLRGAGVGSDGLILSRNSHGSGGLGSHDSDEDDDEDLESGRERLGFDRLRADGLSRSEISALRIYFGRQIDRFIEQRNAIGRNGSGSDSDIDPDDPDPDSTARNRRMRMEDEWMETQGPRSEFRLNLNSNNPLIHRRLYMNSRRPTGLDPMYTGPLGTDRDFIWGFVLGYLIGFMMMFWVWMPTVPHRQKLGILTGICFNMGMNIFNKDVAGSGEGEE